MLSPANGLAQQPDDANRSCTQFIEAVHDSIQRTTNDTYDAQGTAPQMIKQAEAITFLISVGLLIGFNELAPIGPYFGKSWIIWLVVPTGLALISWFTKTTLLRRLVLNVAVFVLVGAGYSVLALKSRDPEGYPLLLVIYSSWIACSSIVILLHHLAESYFVKVRGHKP